MRTQQWVNAGPDDGALPALLGRVAAQLPIPTIDEVWVFPTRRVSAGESTVIVTAAFDQYDERRRVLAFRFVVSRDRRGAATVRVEADELASAPLHAIGRVIEGVLRRLGDDAEVPPHGRSIAGQPQRWNDWIIELGGSAEPAETTQPAESNGEPHAALSPAAADVDNPGDDGGNA